MDQLLYTKPKLSSLLGVGEDVIDHMDLPTIPIGERIYYDIFAIHDYIVNNRRHPKTGKRKCRSTKGKTPITGGTALPSKVVDFAEALKQTTANLPQA